MPTGFSSGGGSSHSSGGGSFGGGFDGGFNNGRRPRGFYGPGVIIINNRPYRMGKASIGYFVCMFLMVIMFFVAFGGGIMMGNASSAKKRIEYDFIKYQDMIEYVENNPSSASERLVTGKVKSVEPGFGKFRVIYEFEYKSRTISGYSFYVYSEHDLDELDYEAGRTIMIVIDPSSLTQYGPDSIPLDFEEFDVEDDGEYAHANFNFKVGVGMLVGGIIGIVGFIVLSNVIFKKCAKPVEENGSSNGNNNNSNNNNSNKDNHDDDNNNNKDNNNSTSGQDDDITYCSYCGARIKKSDRKCPNCGAKS